ncbi:uncharacterized protein LOC111703552 [Eurytemora carolleeae]|uniref:uncharacterized protein LOC111703552 n=1 Tax=Eurytemora carolleeae TaxID=1294199 RepID=UPI000C78E88A|nr:uncharacterized protein LOC111703552 [Eurytemora carolleeae]|eukprot:XP_023331290.1 uncharacterized protein LOC111703552 [Eurytemora affinis]
MLKVYVEATTIVDHRVEISDKLVLKVFIEATTIVDHRVEISDKLVLKVFIEATTIVDHKVEISDKLVIKVYVKATTIVDQRVEISDKLVLKVYVEDTTIVDRRVDISDKLVLKVELNNTYITREFPQFTLDRQLGPLLDSVAALRLCVGYPASRLVHQTRFLLNHQGRLIPETRKLFRLLVVDENFTYRSGVQEERGTIRSTLCCVEAENGSDICTACRALQQPLEFQ